MSEFPGQDFFKLLMTDNTSAFIGGKNRVYNLQLDNLQKISSLEWEANHVYKDKCRMNSKTDCSNYIRVLVRKRGDRIFICGTNAYSPICRHYKLNEENEFEMLRDGEKTGTAICPYHAQSNSTFLFTGGRLYTATRANADGLNPLILSMDENGTRKVRTNDGDSSLLNEPNFVGSFEKDDKVYFLFREVAVENINCGKAVFSRVARVCKQDMGGRSQAWKYYYTSFFKARLNCSIPGEYPFHFNEIHSASDLGQGNFKPTKDSGDRYDMIYGVFNTPQNSIRGSAVCAFRHTDISQVFKERFKGQESPRHNWLPIPWDETPVTHPEQCTKNSHRISDDTWRFTKNHPLMDRAVNPTGGAPVLVFTSVSARLTHIAVDWQLLAADKRYYDIIFVGTDDGRVIKAINKGEGQAVDTVVIEDIQVLEKGKSVTGLKLIGSRADQQQQKLLVVSHDMVSGVPLHRCERATSCSSCVALQDPYCVWNVAMKLCIRAETGIQSIATGEHPSCEPEPSEEKVEVPTVPPTVPLMCSCKTAEAVDEAADVDGIQEIGEADNLKVEASQMASAGGTAVEIVIVAVMASIIVSLVVGFLIGYKFQSCRYRDDVFLDRNCSSLQRGRNRLSSGDNPHFHTDHVGLAPKQMNIVMNRKGNFVETKPVTKSNKVYL
ncbi:semaphorin [Plakobranchus ocellatus]|uniref:Semaphorin n=1 Tax=Plakobranchus ocellatus TaxID=259542 RepID=A0AAV4B3B6_9GAST|nr:semaphorin [Plakobranchus ocellatus]